MTSCPDHETLACFIEQRLDEAAHAKVSEHVAECSSCLDVVAAALGPTPERRAPSPLAPPPAPSRARRWPQALAAGLALLVTGGVGYLATGAASEQARLALVRRATAELGVPVEVSRLEIAVDLQGVHVRLHDIDLGPSDRAAAAELVLSPARLLRGIDAISHLRLFAPALRWTSSETQRQTPSDMRALLALAPAVDVVGATLRLEHGRHEPLLIEGLSASLRSEGTLAYLSAAGRLEGGTLTLEGTLERSDPPRLDLAVGGRDLPSRLLPLIGTWSAGGAALTLTVRGRPGDLRWAGRVHVPDAALRAVALGEGLAEAFNVTASGLGLTGQGGGDLRATFRVDRDGWRIPRASVVEGALEARLTLRTRDGVRLHGEGVGLLGGAPARALVARHRLLALYGTGTGRLAIPIRVTGTPGRLTLVFAP